MSSDHALPSARGAKSVEVAAQAKINLRLRILARETSGYHQLETLFLRLELADTLRIRRTPRECSLDVIGDVNTALLGPVERNLAWRAAEAYFGASGMRGGYAIELEKRIPIGGGLGGGSADAAAVLRALSAIDDEPMEMPRLLGIAAELGADVPFLATEHPYALAWGRGERMVALPAPPQREVLLVVPSFSVNTAEAFGWLADPARKTARRGWTDAFALLPQQLSDWTLLEALAGNDFEDTVAVRYPEVTEHLEFLRAQGCSIYRMSGSGSTLFGIWTSPEAPARADEAMREPRHGVQCIRTRTAARVEQVSVIE